MNKLILILATSILLAGVSASPALSAAPPPPPPRAQAPDDIEAQLSKADPEKLRLARELLVKAKLDEMMQQMVSAAFGNMSSAMDRNLTAGQRQELASIFESIKVGFKRIVPEMTDIILLLYVDNFTAQELADVNAFYDTPSGKAILERQPKIMAAGMPMISAIMPKVIDYGEEDYCTRVTCGDADRALFAKMKAGATRGAAAP